MPVSERMWGFKSPLAHPSRRPAASAADAAGVELQAVGPAHLRHPAELLEPRISRADVST